MNHLENTKLAVVYCLVASPFYVLNVIPRFLTPWLCRLSFGLISISLPIVKEEEITLGRRLPAVALLD